MDGEDSEFKKLDIAEAVSLAFHGFDLVVGSLPSVEVKIRGDSPGLSPNIVTASDPRNSMMIYDSASSAKTLGIMLIIAILGMPFALAYTAVIYWVFRGKVQLGEHSY